MPGATNRRKFLKALGLGSAAVAVARGSWANAPKDPGQPNVLFIALDDLNDWVGCLSGHPDVKTPNMDRLARQGMLFTTAHCPAPVCGTSRIAIMTDKGPASTGCYLNPDDWKRSPALKDAAPLSLHFQRQGYHTMGVGKIYHNPGKPVGDDQLWAEWGSRFTRFGPGKGPHVTRADDAFAGVVGPHFRFLGWGPLDAEGEAQLSDPKAAAWAAERLEQAYEKPFFLGVGFHRPHVPLTAPRRFFDMYDPEKIALPPQKADDLDDLPRMGRQAAVAHFYAAEEGYHQQIVRHGRWRELVHAYLACVSFVDDCVGQVLDALERGPNANNTIVVLWSDHGWGLGERFHWEKWGIWEDVAHVPLIVSAPNLTRPSSRCDAPVSLIDLYPTLVELCGIAPPGPLEGRSFRPLLENPRKSWERPAMTTLGRGNHALRTRRWRYIHWSDGSEELYDHDIDPNEWGNLAEKPAYRKVKEDLKKWLPKEDVPALASHAAGQEFRLQQGQAKYFLHVQPGIAGESVAVSATVEPKAPNGVILWHGNSCVGYALYLKDGKLCFAVMDVPHPLNWNTLKPERTILRAPAELPKGPARVAGRLAADGTMTLAGDGAIVATTKCPGPLSTFPAGVMQAGKPLFWYPQYAPIGDYTLEDVFEGKISDLLVRFGD